MGHMGGRGRAAAAAARGPHARVRATASSVVARLAVGCVRV